jgi:hypothetical protein
LNTYDLINDGFSQLIDSIKASQNPRLALQQLQDILL